jgi:hypothetical protein
VPNEDQELIRRRLLRPSASSACLLHSPLEEHGTSGNGLVHNGHSKSAASMSVETGTVGGVSDKPGTAGRGSRAAGGLRAAHLRRPLAKSHSHSAMSMSVDMDVAAQGGSPVIHSPSDVLQLSNSLARQFRFDDGRGGASELTHSPLVGLATPPLVPDASWVDAPSPLRRHRTNSITDATERRTAASRRPRLSSGVAAMASPLSTTSTSPSSSAAQSPTHVTAGVPGMATPLDGSIVGMATPLDGSVVGMATPVGNGSAGNSPFAAQRRARRSGAGVAPRPRSNVGVQLHLEDDMALSFVRVLGRGATGMVYLATLAKPGFPPQQVAVKQFLMR